MTRLLPRRKKGPNTPIVCRTGEGDFVAPPPNIGAIALGALDWASTPLQRTVTINVSANVTQLPPGAPISVQIPHGGGPFGIVLSNGSNATAPFQQLIDFPVIMVNFTAPGISLGTVFIKPPLHPF